MSRTSRHSDRAVVLVPLRSKHDCVIIHNANEDLRIPGSNGNHVWIYKRYDEKQQYANGL